MHNVEKISIFLRVFEKSYPHSTLLENGTILVMHEFIHIIHRKFRRNKMNFGREKEKTFWSNFIKLLGKWKKLKNLLTKIKSKNGEKGIKL